MQRRRERYSIIMIWKMATGNAPNNIGVKFLNNARLGKKVEVPTSPTTTQVSVSTKYHNSFACRAARLWNTLPRNVNMAENLASFKVLLGKWLETFPDRPPVSGYTRQNNNSIIDWVRIASREGEALWGAGTCAVFAQRGLQGLQGSYQVINVYFVLYCIPDFQISSLYLVRGWSYDRVKFRKT